MSSRVAVTAALVAIVTAGAALASTARVDLTTASAPLEMSPADLGRYYDANLRPLQAKVPTERSRTSPAGDVSSGNSGRSIPETLSG